METLSWEHGPYTISTDPDRFDEEAFHTYLTNEAYWARGRRRETTAAAVSNSLLFGVYAPTGVMVAAARVVTDCATFGWLCDLYVLRDHRGRGLGKALVKAVREHPCLSDTKRLLLATDDAHELYSQHGFEGLRAPQNWMEYEGETV